MDTTNDFDILKEEDNFAIAPQKAEQIPIPAKELNNPLAVACDHLGVSVNQEQLSILDTFMERAQHGHQAALPMMCKATKCPFLGHCPLAMAKMELPEGKLCHPPGTMILTADKTWIAIENLKQDKDLLITYCQKKSSQGPSNGFKIRGRSFKLGSRYYQDDLIEIHANNFTHSCTKDHICLARYNENAVGKFAVYLMKKDDKFRVGKTQLIWEAKNGKRHSGLAQRGRDQQADCMWILGLYNTNTEALLAEEKFSLDLHAPRALFIATRDREKTKYNGLYAWVTQEELDNHHESCKKPLQFYADYLKLIGQDILYPIWEYNNAQWMGGTNMTFEIRACNLIADVMSVPTVNNVPTYFDRAIFYPVKLNRKPYSGIVYSLDVEGEKTYIANNIVTHNCPVERSMIVKWVHKTLIALDIDPHDPENAVDMDMAMELAGMELIRYRAACHMADDPALTEERIVGYSPQGQPIYDEKPKINLLILERQAKLIGRLREQLLATRKAQAQVGRVASDVSVKAANMLQKARDLAEKRKSGQEALDATYTVKDERGKQTGL